MEMEQFDTHPVNDYQAHHILSAERLILISAQNSSRSWLAKPASAGWWMRVLTVVLFVFHINFVRFHLLTEPHFDDFWQLLSFGRKRLFVQRSQTHRVSAFIPNAGKFPVNLRPIRRSLALLLLPSPSSVSTR
ncbi:MAG: hypothetical protein DME24_23260 [Verrucomicrobia bacterium]|nr:MAG: hypothetical protein DME24_23260 [Verrucomicrobiota bacterium]